MSSLKVTDISMHFGAREVLRNISLAFDPGTVTALVGDNGAGKSTFLKILAGVLTPTSGTIFLGAESLSHSSPGRHRSAGIEMVYQDLALAKSHDVATNLFIGRELTNRLGTLDRRRMNDRATGILEQLQVRIPNIQAPVGTLSGGQQQAIALARAILFNPKVLLLDEPTAALAVREVEQVLELIRSQKKQDRIVILVSHRLNDVVNVADRVVVLKRGEFFSDDPASSLSLADIIERIVS